VVGVVGVVLEGPDATTILSTFDKYQA